MTSPQRLRFPPALFALVLACRSALGESSGQWIHADGDELLAWSRRHRVQGLVWKGLNRLGVGGRYPAIRKDAHLIVQENLRAVERVLAIRDAFAAGMVPVAFVKGLAVGALAYGEPGIKMSADIDILVASKDLEAAAECLETLGYRRELPRSGSLSSWHQLHKESIWVGQSGPSVELHSRLADHPAILSEVSDAIPDQVEIIPGEFLPTIPGIYLLPYLAVHGASSLWFRLKWLADYVAVARSRPASALPRTERALTLANQLGSAVFGTDADNSKNDPVENLLFHWSLAQIRALAPPTERSLGTMTIHLGQALLSGGAGFAVSDMVRQARSVIRRG